MRLLIYEYDWPANNKKIGFRKYNCHESICFQYFIVERKTIENIGFETTICHKKEEHNMTDHVLGTLSKSVMLITI